jgi:hypothetical protein
VVVCPAWRSSSTPSNRRGGRKGRRNLHLTAKDGPALWWQRDASSRGAGSSPHPPAEVEVEVGSVDLDILPDLENGASASLQGVKQLPCQLQRLLLLA